MVFVRVIGQGTATGITLQFKCIPGPACRATANLSALLRSNGRHGILQSGHYYVRTVLATARFTLGGNRRGNEFFRFTAAGMARLGGNNYYKHFG